MDISAAVRSARRARGLSQRELAAELGISAATVAAWEAGRRVPAVASLRKVLALQGLELCAQPGSEGRSDDLVRHLHLPLTVRLRLVLGEPASPYARATSDAWRALLVLGRLGCAVLQPPVATGIWIPAAPRRMVSVVVHAPRGELPALPGADITVAVDPAPASLVPVTVEGPVRVWVLPPAGLLADSAYQLRQAADLLAESNSRDDAGRRAPAHRDPNEWVEAARMLMTKGTDDLERPIPELGRAWRLGGPVSLSQAVRLRTWQRSAGGGRAGR